MTPARALSPQPAGPIPAEERGQGAGAAAGLTLLAVLSLMAASAVAAIRPQYAVVMIGPAALVGAIACTLRPAAAVVGIFALTGFEGTFLAYTPFPTRGLQDLLLVGLWLGVAWRYVTYRQRPTWVWPGLLIPLLYIVLTGIEVVFSDPLAISAEAFRLSVFPMTAMFLIAVAPWHPETSKRIVKGLIVVAMGVGLYALLRWRTGPTTAEFDLARLTRPDFPPDQFRVFGSFPGAPALSGWAALVGPLMLGVALLWRGRWRWAAAAAVPLLGFAAVASEARTGVIALVFGIVFTLVAFMASRSLPGGVRLGRGLVAAAGVVVLAVGAYMATAGSSELGAERFGRILDPSEDVGWDARLVSWEEAIDDMGDNPFGRGLGRVGTVVLHGGREDYFTEFRFSLDNGYLKVGVEQGAIVMGLFALGLLSVLLGLTVRATATTDRERAAVAIGAAGSLAAFMVMLIGGTWLEEAQAMAAWMVIGLGLAQFTRRGDEAEGGSATSEGDRRDPAADAT